MRFPPPHRVNPGDAHWRLRRLFLTFYVRDEHFRSLLRSFGNSKEDSGEFCHRCGLTFDDNNVEESVLDWRDNLALVPNLDPSDLLSFYGWGGPVPNRAYTISHTPHITVSWDPLEESREDARTRILQEIGTRLGKETDKHVEKALINIDTRFRAFERTPRQKQQRLHEHMRWLFLRQFYGWTYKKISESHSARFVTSENSVRLACQRLSKILGLILRSRIALP